MSPAKMAKLENAIRLVLDFVAAFNNHSIPGMLELLSDDCFFETAFPAPGGLLYSGRAEITHYLHDTFDQYLEAHIEIEEIFSLSFRCVMRWRLEWLSGSGEQSHLRGVDIFQVKDGLISQCVSYTRGLQ
jgi:hypothetical protein